jgi:hypothetical protein
MRIKDNKYCQNCMVASKLINCDPKDCICSCHKQKYKPHEKWVTLGGVSKGFTGHIYFSDASKTIDAWSGGTNYRLLWELNLLGYRFVFWKKE